MRQHEDADRRGKRFVAKGEPLRVAPDAWHSPWCSHGIHSNPLPADSLELAQVPAFTAPDIEKAPVRRPEQLESNRTIAGLQVPVKRWSRHGASLPSSSLHHAATWSLVATHGFR